MERDARKNKIMNEIISSDASVVILLAESDGTNIGFLSEIEKFYRYTFWFNAEYEHLGSLPMELAEKILADNPSASNKILQLRHCEFGFDGDKNIINVILEKIASVNGDCFMVIDNAEKISSAQLPLLELFLKNAPKNLKIVLISEKIIDIDYNAFRRICPKLIDCRTDKGGKSSLKEYNLTCEQKAFLLYVGGRHVERDFCRRIYGGAEELLNFLHLNRRDLVFAEGKDLFYVDKRVCDLLENETGLRDSAFFDIGVEERLWKYFSEKGKFLSALKMAIGLRDGKKIDRTVSALAAGGKYMFALYDFCKERALSDTGTERFVFPDVHFEHGVELIIAVYGFYLKRYGEVADYAAKILSDIPVDSPLGTVFRHLIFMCATESNFSGEALAAAKNFLSSMPSDGTTEQYIALIPFLSKLPGLFRKVGVVTTPDDFRRLETTLNDKKYASEYWYPEILRFFAEMYFEWGNCNKAVKYVESIKTILPFYVIPCKFLEFYYYAGDVEYARDAADNALRTAYLYDTDADVTAIYVLLARIACYLNRMKIAEDYIERAVNCKSGNGTSKYFAIAIRSVIYAKTGRTEYGRDMAVIYAKYCETYSIKAVSYLYGALAYCGIKLGDVDFAMFYAKKCISDFNVHPGAKLLSAAIIASILLRKGELRDADATVEKILNSCVKCGMITVAADYGDCFEELLRYASVHNIATEHLVEIEKKTASKQKAASGENTLTIKLMGVTRVLAAGREIKWKTKKAKELFLLYVWLGIDGLERKFILNALWGDYLYESAVNNLKTTNNIIRNALKENSADFRLSYGNGRYTLTLKKAECDFTEFQKTLEEFERANLLQKRLAILRKVLSSYEGGFAKEIETPCFKKYARDLRERLCVDVLRLVKELISAEKYLDAKRYLKTASDLDGGDFIREIADLSQKLRGCYE